MWCGLFITFSQNQVEARAALTNGSSIFEMLDLCFEKKANDMIIFIKPFPLFQTGSIQT